MGMPHNLPIMDDSKVHKGAVTSLISELWWNLDWSPRPLVAATARGYCSASFWRQKGIFILQTTFSRGEKVALDEEWGPGGTTNKRPLSRKKQPSHPPADS